MEIEEGQDRWNVQNGIGDGEKRETSDSEELCYLQGMENEVCINNMDVLCMKKVLGVGTNSEKEGQSLKMMGTFVEYVLEQCIAVS